MTHLNGRIDEAEFSKMKRRERKIKFIMSISAKTSHGELSRMSDSERIRVEKRYCDVKRKLTFREVIQAAEGYYEHE